MPIQPTYKTGTVTVTSSSATVTGTGTAWTLALANGGSLSFKGFSIPIAAVASDTSLTLDYPAPAGMAGAGAYSIDLGRADAASAIVANRQLADLVDLLRNKVSAFGATLIDDPDAGTALTTLGFSTFFKTLVDEVNGTAVRTAIQAADALAVLAKASNLSDVTDKAAAMAQLLAITASTASNVDLNTLVTAGRFNISGGTAINSPINMFGVLTVERFTGSGFGKQHFDVMAGSTVAGNNRMFDRAFIVDTTNSFSPWRERSYLS